MPIYASLPLRWIYCLAIVSAVFPVGVSGWVTMTMGPSVLASVPLVSPVLLLALGIFRIYQVVTDRDRLDSVEISGLIRLLRIVGLVAMFIGVLYLVLQLGYRPLVSALVDRRSESGVEFYLAGIYVALLSGTGSLGVVLFEASRILGFEAQAKKA